MNSPFSYIGKTVKFSKAEKVSSFEFDMLFHLKSIQQFRFGSDEKSLKELSRIVKLPIEFLGIDLKNNVIHGLKYFNSLYSIQQIKSYFSFQVPKNEFNDFLKMTKESSNFEFITDKYGKAIYLVSGYIGIQRSQNDYDKFYEYFSKTEFPPSWKQVPNIVYRGYIFSKTVINKIIAEKQFSLNPRKLSSWSTSKNIAETHISDGIVLNTKPKASDILFNISDPGDKYWQILKKFFHKTNEGEIVLKGNGIAGRIQKENISSIIVDGKEIKL